MHFQEEKSHLAKMGPKDVSGLERSVLETDNLLDWWGGGGCGGQATASHTNVTLGSFLALKLTLSLQFLRRHVIKSIESHF